MLPKELRAEGGVFPVTSYQTTDQIAALIKRAILESAPAGDYLRQYFYRQDPIKSLKLIYAFTDNIIKYKREPGKNQTAKTLQRIIADSKTKTGDCKHYSTTAATLCRALGIPVKLRLIGQDLAAVWFKAPTHIYAVAVVNGNEIILDPCAKGFNKQVRFTYKKDVTI